MVAASVVLSLNMVTAMSPFFSFLVMVRCVPSKVPTIVAGEPRAS